MSQPRIEPFRTVTPVFEKTCNAHKQPCSHRLRRIRPKLLMFRRPVESRAAVPEPDASLDDKVAWLAQYSPHTLETMQRSLEAALQTFRPTSVPMTLPRTRAKAGKR